MEHLLRREIAKRKEGSKEYNILLLGPSGSGKSTIFKQMRILHLKGFSQEEIRWQRRLVFANIVEATQALLRAITQFEMDVPLIIRKQRERNRVLSVKAEELSFLPCELVNIIREIWEERKTKKCFERRSEFNIEDTAKYFLDNLDRISSPDYLPSVADLLHLRQRTVHREAISFIVKDTHFKVIDMGGLRSERRKWFHCFEEQVSAMLYVVAVSEYDQMLVEDEHVNRMKDALDLFQVLVNSTFFKNSAIILFLNKMDLFKEKIKRVPIQTLYSGYTGAQTWVPAINYIEQRFRQQTNLNQPLYTHRTWATDGISTALNAAYKIIVSTNLTSKAIH